MAIAKVGTSITSTGSGNLTLIRTAGTTGNLLVLMLSSGNTNTTNFTISDTQANTWVEANPFTGGGTAGNSRCFYALAKNTSSTTITGVEVGSASAWEMALDEFSGVDQTTPLDKHGEQTGSGTPTSPARTPTNVGAMAWGGTPDTVTAVGAGFTKASDDTAGDWSEYQLNASGSITVTFTGSGTYCCNIAIYNPVLAAATDAQEWMSRLPHMTGPIIRNLSH